MEGRFAQAFPSFGSERTGAPVMAFCRIDDRPIRVREPVVRPDALIVQDPTLLHQADVFEGLRPAARRAQEMRHDRTWSERACRRRTRRLPGKRHRRVVGSPYRRGPRAARPVGLAARGAALRADQSASC
ncbi:2-oxoacid:acceptor oxidoreductase family protein [Streptomyces pseudovenezuelae]|uniref:2-oxoacid:acceptor oxidoreductase family protein n=1 Tax=Streptomyces pseudovenezuelae TaxID=67350 RepID=UPI002E304C23|nr:2-oxoacid:acceptor oxidoreductase family protein [Streptomyces pseudovenezuelae]